MHVGARGDQKRAQDSLELELKAVVRQSIWVLGTGVRYFERSSKHTGMQCPLFRPSFFFLLRLKIWRTGNENHPPRLLQIPSLGCR